MIKIRMIKICSRLFKIGMNKITNIILVIIEMLIPQVEKLLRCKMITKMSHHFRLHCPRFPVLSLKAITFTNNHHIDLKVVDLNSEKYFTHFKLKL